MKKAFILFVLPFWIILCLVCARVVLGESRDDFKAGVDLFEAGKYEQALQIFKRVFEDYPSDPELNFYLGRAAFETGDYESAIMAFDRVLIVNPSATRVKLEMARAYQKLEVNSMARQYCNEVLQTHPPPAVKANIEQFLAYIDKSEQRNFIKGSISIGFNYDDNVYASPINRMIETILGNGTLTGTSAEKTSDRIYTTAADLIHSYKFGGSGVYWKTSADVYDAMYENEESLDTFYLQGTTGPEWISGRYKAGIEFLANHLSLNGSTYQNGYGVDGILGYLATPNLCFETNLTFEQKNFEASVRDTDRLAFSLDAFFPVKSIWFDVGITIERWNADSDEYSFNRYSGEVTFQRKIPYGMTIIGNYEFRYSGYDGSSPWFNKERQDQVHYTMVGIEKRLWQHTGKGCLTVNLNYLYTVADSSIDLYEYRKNEVFSSLTYRF